MEKIQPKEKQTFLQKLKSPLGIGTAIGVSITLGLAIAYLKKKLKGPKSLYQQLTEKIKEKIKDSNLTNPYTDELIILVYQCTPTIAQDHYDKALQIATEKQQGFIDDIPRYSEAVAEFGMELIKLLKDSYNKIIEEAGGLPNLFIQVEQQRRQASSQIRRVYMDMVAVLRQKHPSRPNKKELTLEVVKETLKYQLKLFEDLASGAIKAEFPDPSLTVIWVPDKTYVKFGIDVTSEDYAQAMKKFIVVDLELREIDGKIGRITSEIMVKLLG